MLEVVLTKSDTRQNPAVCRHRTEHSITYYNSLKIGDSYANLGYISTHFSPGSKDIMFSEIAPNNALTNEFVRKMLREDNVPVRQIDRKVHVIPGLAIKTEYEILKEYSREFEEKANEYNVTNYTLISSASRKIQMFNIGLDAGLICIKNSPIIPNIVTEPFNTYFDKIKQYIKTAEMKTNSNKFRISTINQYEIN